MELNKQGFLRVSKKFEKNIYSRNFAPTVFQLAGCFLINKKSFLKYKKLHMPKEIPYIITPKKGLMIDTEFEFEIASKL
jgi:CMP-N-acetylneuraminic acid synthetase